MDIVPSVGIRSPPTNFPEDASGRASVISYPKRQAFANHVEESASPPSPGRCPSPFGFARTSSPCGEVALAP